MNKKSTFNASIISLASPVLLALLFALTVLFESISRTNVFYEFFSRFSLAWLFFGWLIGLIAAIYGVLSAFILKKEGEKTVLSICLSIVGIILNGLWIIILSSMFSMFTGV